METTETPWERFITNAVRSEAAKRREAMLQLHLSTTYNVAFLQKFQVVTLKAALTCKGLYASGSKHDLIARLLDHN